jgi:hypothetical protein
MHMRRLIGLLVTTALLSGPVNGQTTPAPLPAWIQQKIAEFEAQPEHPDATEIWRLQNRGQDAIYLVSGCCDRNNPLVDANGKVFCAPTGGITGQGDGQCIGALHTTPERVRIWEAPNL